MAWYITYASSKKPRYLEIVFEDNRVRRYQQERRVVRQDRAAAANQLWKALIELPDLPFRTASEFRRIENDSLIEAPAAGFALNELKPVVENPANPILRYAAGPLILLRPLDRLFRRV